MLMLMLVLQLSDTPPPTEPKTRRVEIINQVEIFQIASPVKLHIETQYKNTFMQTFR